MVIADMLTLSKQLVETEAALDGPRRESVQQRHRIDTSLLTMAFQPSSTEKGGPDIGQACRGSGQILARSNAWLIRAVGFLIPLLTLLGAMVGARRWRSSATKAAG